MNTQYFLAYTKGEGDNAENVHHIYRTPDLLDVAVAALPRTQEFVSGPITKMRTFQIVETKKMGRKPKVA